MVLTTLLTLALSQLDMTPSLQKGPLVLVEEAAGGKFGQATAIILVNAPPERVWETVLKVDEFKTYMPKVTTSEITRKGEKDFDAHIVIEVPGPDTEYNLRYTPNHATRTMEGTWLSGDLKGSRWFWKVEAAPGGKTLLSHALQCKNFSGIAQSFEDDAQTITVGINVSSALAAAKAVKKRCEEPVQPAPAAAAK